MRKPSAWSENHRLRSELTPMLVDIALQQDIGTFLAESITFIYPDRGADWIDESTPIEAGNPILGSVFDLEHEVERFSAAGRRGVTLRFALFYGPTAESTRAALRYARLRVAMSPGGTGYQSNVHTDDAGAAVAAALTAPAGTYNIGDDEPLPRPEFAEAFATAFDLGRLRQLPPAVVRLAGGPGTVSVLRSQRVRNSRFKETTGWAPRHPSAREGWKACAAAMQEEKAHA
jgi:nucleoside-diphosphate-sugar epimerase